MVGRVDVGPCVGRERHDLAGHRGAARPVLRPEAVERALGALLGGHVLDRVAQRLEIGRRVRKDVAEVDDRPPSAALLDHLDRRPSV